VLELLILDLEQNGVEINSAGQVYAYEAKDSKKNSPIQWVGKDDAILYLDMDGSGTANVVDEYDFKKRMPGSVNLLNILNLFDTDNDKVLDSSDAFYSKLRIWTDENGNGLSEVSENKFLAEIGVVIYVDPAYGVGEERFQFRVKSLERNHTDNYVRQGYKVNLKLIK
jgi:trimeric autotransporter adhesin